MKINWPPQRMKSRTMMAIPLAVAAILLVAVLILGLPMGRDFQGGTLVTARGMGQVPELNNVKVQAQIIAGTAVDVRGTADGFDIETAALTAGTENQLKEMLMAQFGLREGDIAIGALGPAVSAAQASEIAVLGTAALVAMGVIIFIFRRRMAATSAIVVSILNAVGTLGLMAILRVPLNLASIIGLLLMLGFVIDADVLFAYRLLKGAVGDPKENVGEALKAVLAMSAAAIAALLSIALAVGAAAVTGMALTLVIAISLNLFNTCFLGVPLLMRHVEHKKVVSYHVSI